MVKPAPQDVDAELWVHAQKLGTMPPSICVFHDCCTAGSELQDTLAELGTADRPAQRAVTFRSSVRPGSLHKLKLIVDLKSAALRVMHVSHDDKNATIVMTDDGLKLLQDAVTSWLNGREDFGVSPRSGRRQKHELGIQDRQSGELWFWGPGYAGP